MSRVADSQMSVSFGKLFSGRRTCAPCKALNISDLTVFRVEQTATLKTIKTLVFRELRVAPQPKSKVSIYNRGYAYISDRNHSPCQSQLHPPHPTIATTSEQVTSTISDRLSQPRPYSSPAIFGINVMSAGSQATESSWSEESQRAASCSRRCGLPPAIVQA